jgi:hypothetical protein
MTPILFVETHQHFNEFDEVEYSSESFCVDLDKVKQFAKDFEHEYRYIAHLIEAATKEGRMVFSTSRKFSFGDCPDWYSPILIDEVPTELVISYDVDFFDF